MENINLVEQAGAGDKNNEFYAESVSEGICKSAKRSIVMTDSYG